MTVPSVSLSKYLLPDVPIELRQVDRKLATGSLSYTEAFALITAGEVEGKVVNSKLKYLRLLPPEEIKLRLELERVAKVGVVRGYQSSSTAMTANTMGARRESLPEATVASDIFGHRVVISEGEMANKVWSHVGLNF